MIVKEIHQILRDPRALAILVVVPTAMLIFLGYVISLDMRHIGLAVLDEDGSDLSRRLVRQITIYDHFDLVEIAGSRDDLERAVFLGRARVGLHVPRGLEKDVTMGRPVAVQAILDGTNSTQASTARGYLTAYIQAFDIGLAQAPGQAAPAAAGAQARVPSGPGLVSARVRLFYNPEMRSSLFLIPGLIAFILALANSLATALSIVREKERGTMEQIRLSPIGPLTFVIGKTVPYVLISIASASLILAAGKLLFGLPLRGDPLILALATFVFILCTLGLGLLISTITDSQQVAFTVAALLTMLPTFLLSGFVFPIRNMPYVIQLITYVVPARYYIRALRGVILQGAPWEVVAPEIAALCVLTAVMLAVATIRMHRGGLSS